MCYSTTKKLYQVINYTKQETYLKDQIPRYFRIKWKNNVNLEFSYFFYSESISIPEYIFGIHINSGIYIRNPYQLQNIYSESISIPEYIFGIHINSGIYIRNLYQFRNIYSESISIPEYTFGIYINSRIYIRNLYQFRNIYSESISIPE